MSRAKSSTAAIPQDALGRLAHKAPNFAQYLAGRRLRGIPAEGRWPRRTI